MTNDSTKSPRNLAVSKMEKLRREKFVLLARVGQQKRKASQLRDEAEHYYGIVIELLALLEEAMVELRSTKGMDKSDPVVADLMCRHMSLTKRLLAYWPRNSESQERASNLLDCAGLAKVTDLTEDGFVTRSMALVLESVERIIEATRKESNPRASSS